MTVKCHMFQSSTRSWESLAEEAAAYASDLGPQQLINISAVSNGTDLGALGVILVWYRESN